MSSDRDIFEGSYTQGSPFVTAVIVVANELTGRVTTIRKQLKIDTGFDGGIHVAHLHRDSIALIGVNLTSGLWEVAGGGRVNADHCHAYLQQIGEFEFPRPGIETILVLQGSSDHGLLGLEVLNNWLLMFNGPNRSFKISHPEE